MQRQRSWANWLLRRKRLLALNFEETGICQDYIGYNDISASSISIKQELLQTIGKTPRTCAESQGPRCHWPRSLLPSGRLTTQIRLELGETCRWMLLLSRLSEDPALDRPAVWLELTGGEWVSPGATNLSSTIWVILGQSTIVANQKQFFQELPLFSVDSHMAVLAGISLKYAQSLHTDPGPVQIQSLSSADRSSFLSVSWRSQNQSVHIQRTQGAILHDNWDAVCPIATE